MIFFTHPTGNANVRQALSALESSGHLGVFQTTLGFSRNGVWRRLPHVARHRLGRRAYDLPATRMRRRPLREIWRLSGLPLAPSVFEIYKDLDRASADWLRENALEFDIDAVYAYEDGALETFGVAPELGIRRIYELPIGYWRAAQRIYAEEAERESEWKATLTGLRDSQEKLDRKDAELTLANQVLVASTFTARTLSDAPGRPTSVSVVPYGMDPPKGQVTVGNGSHVRAKREPLAVIYVGALTQRKGIAYLFRAVRELEGMVRLTVIGRKAAACAALDRALRGHRWIPSLPHEEVLDEIARHDVLVLPSLFEGFGLVLTEALSRGTPVIATDHTAAPDLFEDGTAGWIVPIRDSDSIAERLAELYHDRDRLAWMSQQALLCAHGHTWGEYRETLIRRLDLSGGAPELSDG